MEAQADGPTLFAPAHHPVLPSDVNLKRLSKIIRVAHERHPADFETLLGTSAVSPATIRISSRGESILLHATRRPSKRPPCRQYIAHISSSNEAKTTMVFFMRS